MIVVQTWLFLTVVFNQVMPRTLQVSYLHEVSSEHYLSIVDIVVMTVEISAAQLEVIPGHDVHQHYQQPSILYG